LLSRPDATTADIMAHVKGPDFPTGGVIVEPHASMLETYETGRGGVRHRALWAKEETGRGTYQIVVTQIPYQVRKADLVEQIAGLLIAFLNLDEVIRIVRFEDEPKAKLIAAFELSETQAEAILNTRLRQLARLEEMELRREHAELAEERDQLLEMLGSDKLQWKLVAVGLKDVRGVLGPETTLGKRRSLFAAAPNVDPDAAIEAMVVREPITVILSERGWIRAQKGRVEDPSELKFKEGDKLGFLVPAETTDKLLIFASDGRFFTLGCDKLPGARGNGEPLRLMLDLDDKVGIVDVFAHKPGAKRFVASRAGYGFVLPEEDAIAFRRAGKQVLGVDAKGAAFALPLTGDQVAVIGDNGKILVFPVSELPEMGRGKGVKLQAYREGGLRDALVFDSAEGASWIDTAGRTRAWTDWGQWAGKRAGSGKLAPRGFPASKRFRPK
ncbi:MAG: DNA gyrase subunit A, partial [Phenylobacterium sp.]